MSSSSEQGSDDEGERARKVTEARYAKERRDTEKNAREFLESNVPTQYHQSIGGDGLKRNIQGKAMEAAGGYITDLKAEINRLKAAAATVSPPRARATGVVSSPFPAVSCLFC